MKLKKLILTIVFALVLFIPSITKAEGLVKVYIFEAGGCPYCEAEVEYLEGLDGYGTKFTIERKELYVDHIDWAQGEDYELGKIVANAFNAAGFSNADYQGTPFVVISNIYASTGYSESLEEVINEAYENGDADVVQCYADGKSDCLDGINVGKLTTKNKTYSYIALGVILVVAVAFLGYSKAKVN